MKVDELIDVLKSCDPDATVILAMQDIHELYSTCLIDITEENSGKKHAFVQITGYVDVD